MTVIHETANEIERLQAEIRWKDGQLYNRDKSIKALEMEIVHLKWDIIYLARPWWIKVLDWFAARLGR